MSDGGHGGGGGHGKRRGGHDDAHEEHENHERWLVSYADMMTLLMVLFIVLFAISQVDSKKFMALKTGLAAGFGAPVAIMYGADQLLDVGGAVAPDSVNLAGTAGGQAKNSAQSEAVNPDKVAELAKAMAQANVKQEVNNLVKAQKEIQQALNKQGLKGAATFTFDERGLHVIIATDKVLFDSGSAVLRPEGRTILDAVTPTIAKLPNKLSIDGHTNTIPIHTAQFPSNWELSTGRATGVLRYLASKIEVDRMSASGFADTRPLKPYTDPRAMTINRRVEIVVLAAVDNSLGQAVATLGQKAEQAAGTDSATTEGSAATGSGAEASPAASPAAASSDDPWATPSAAASSAPSDWTQDGTSGSSGSGEGGSGSSAGSEPAASAAASDDPWGTPAAAAAASPTDWTK